MLKKPFVDFHSKYDGYEPVSSPDIQKCDINEQNLWSNKFEFE